MLAFLGNILRNVVSVFLLPTNYTNPNREDAMGVYNICFGKEMTGSELFRVTSFEISQTVPLLNIHDPKMLFSS